jgi:hypothetical protein
MVSGDQRRDGNIPIMSFSGLSCECPLGCIWVGLMVGIQ